MQTSKIKVGEVYALHRGQGLVRFHVTEIVTRKGLDKATNEIVGNIIEDNKPGVRASDIKVEPGDLLGPYAEQAELVERKAKEDAEREAKQVARDKEARADRIALYRFVGIEPPKDAKAFHQHFSLSYGSVDIRNEGKVAIIARVRELQDAARRGVTPAVNPAGVSEVTGLHVVKEG